MWAAPAYPHGGLALNPQPSTSDLKDTTPNAGGANPANQKMFQAAAIGVCAQGLGSVMKCKDVLSVWGLCNRVSVQGIGLRAGC